MRPRACACNTLPWAPSLPSDVLVYEVNSTVGRAQTNGTYEVGERLIPVEGERALGRAVAASAGASPTPRCVQLGLMPRALPTRQKARHLSFMLLPPTPTHPSSTPIPWLFLQPWQSS